MRTGNVCRSAEQLQINDRAIRWHKETYKQKMIGNKKQSTLSLKGNSKNLLLTMITRRYQSRICTRTEKKILKKTKREILRLHKHCLSIHPLSSLHLLSPSYYPNLFTSSPTMWAGWYKLTMYPSHVLITLPLHTNHNSL